MVLRSITALKNSGGQDLVVVSFLDVTEHQKAEKELKESYTQLERANIQLQMHKDQIVQTEKLASIGQLAAGVAHEINNPVGYVTSNLGTIQEYCVILKNILTRYGELDDAETGAEFGRCDERDEAGAVRDQRECRRVRLPESRHNRVGCGVGDGR